MSRSIESLLNLCGPGLIGRIVPLLLPVLVTALVYVPVCGYGFLNYDDNLHVYANPLVRQFDWPAFLSLWQRPYQGLYIPLTYTVWGLAAKLSPGFPGIDANGLAPGLFHAINLLVHLAAVLVVFDLLRRLLRDDLGAVAGALLFGLHPVQVEAVAWISGLKDLLGGLCSLLALRQYLLYLTSREKRVVDYGLASIFYLAALLAKPSAVMVPLLAAVMGLALSAQTWPKLARELGPWLALALVIALVTGTSQDAALIGFQPSFGQRFLVVGDTYCFYLRKLFLLQTSTIDYGRTAQAVLAGRWIYLAGLVPCLLFAVFFRFVRQPLPRLAGAIFILALLPVSGLVSFYFQRVSTVADRYLYLAMFGPALLLGWLVAVRGTSLARGLVAALLLLCVGLSQIQVRSWENFEIFYRRNLQVNPDSWFMRNNFGTAYNALGEWEKAEEQFRLAIRSNPRYPLPYNNLGMIRMKQGRFGEAADYFRQAVAVADRYYLAYQNLGSALAAMGKKEEALAAFRRVAEIKPDFPVPYFHLGRLYQESGRNDEAIAAYRRAIELDDGAIEPRLFLAALYLEVGRSAEAVALYRQVLAIEPNCAGAYNGLGLVALAAGDLPTALAAFQEAVGRDGQYAEAYFNLARTHEKSGRHDLAGTAAARGRALTGSGQSAEHVWPAGDA